jgi:hypothetical protein
MSQTVSRTGPIGRLARLVIAAVYAATLLSIADSRLSARFRNPHVLTEPAVWLVHVVMFITFVILVGALASAATKRRWQIGAVVALAAAVGVAALIGLVTRGAAWGFPLADLVWWFDVLMLVEGLAASALAAVLGTPGCEIGVWNELRTRAGGGSFRPEDGLACIVGLHLLDGWEARRRLA